MAFSIPGFDPIGDLLQQNAMLGQRNPIPQVMPPQSAPLPQLSTQEESDLLSQLGAVGGSALNFIGETLDKTFGGRAVRGILSGHPEQLASLIPFSDTIGLTDKNGWFGNHIDIADKSDVPSGRGLLEQAGVLDPKGPDDGFDLGDVAGMATQAVLDPATWLTPFGLSKAGEIAKGLGVLPKAATGLNKVTGALEGGITGGAGRFATGVKQTLGEALGSNPELMQGAAQMAAKHGWSIDDLLNQPLRGGVGFGLPIPFTSNLATFGHGPIAQGAGNALDSLMAGIRYSGLGRGIARYLNVPSKELSSTAGQIASKEGFDENLAKTQGIRLARAGDFQKAEAAGVLPQMRGVIEKTGVGLSENAADRTFEQAAGTLPEAAQGPAVDVAHNVSATEAEQAAEAKEMGRDIGLQDTTIPHVAREATNIPEELQRGGIKQKSIITDSKNAMGRQDYLKGIGPTESYPGGTASINQLGKDQRMIQLPDSNEASGFRPTTPEEAKDIVWKDVLGRTDEDAKTLANYSQVIKKAGGNDEQAAKIFGKTMGDPVAGQAEADKYVALKAKDAQAQILADLAQKGQLPEFGNDAISDAARGQVNNQDMLSGEKITHNLLARTAYQAAEGDKNPSVLDVLRKNQMSGPGAATFQLKTMLNERDLLPEEQALLQGHLDALKAGKTTFEEVLAKSVASAPQELSAESIAAGDSPFGGGGRITPEVVNGLVKQQNDAFKGAMDFLGNMRVNPEHYTDANRVMEFLRKGPNATSESLAWYRSFTQLGKALLTAPWPANKVRDRITGLWQQFATGSHAPGAGGALNPMNWIRPNIEASLIHEGGVIKNAAERFGFKGMNDAQATNALRQEVYATKLNDVMGYETAEIAPDVTSRVNKSIGAQMPQPFNPGFMGSNFIKGAIPKTLEEANPLNVRGFGARTEDKFAPVAAGRQATNWVDSQNRTAIFLAKREQGLPYQEAAAISKAANVDYSALTPFERNKIQRYAVPFWTWSRHIVPWTLQELASHPGGVTAQAVRVAGGTGSPKGFIPRQLEGDLALPLGKENEQGNAKFLSGLDLPFETLTDVFHPGATTSQTIERTLAGWGGMLNPIARVPIELATNRQLYSGRELSDLRGRTGIIAGTLSGMLGGSDRPWAVPTPVEEAISNSPLSRLVSTVGKLTDERKSPIEKALNTVTGVHTTDVDMNRARDVAARDAATTLLSGNPDVRKFTSIYVKPEDRLNLTPIEQKLMALYQDLGKQQAARAKVDRAKEALTAPAR